MAAEEHRFPCTTCGADLRFAPGTDMLICDHCGNTEALDGTSPWTGAITEIDFLTAVDGALPDSEMEETRVLSCANCGAQVEFSPEVHSAECPFCATPVVTDTGIHRHIKPKGVLPFALNDAAARKAMTDWLGSLWFAPNGLQAYARQGRPMQGVYMPYWTFDADTRTRYSGERGTVHSRGTGKNRRTYTRWRNVSGRVARFFDDVLVLSSRSLPAEHSQALEPWDLAALEPYRPEYLAGFRAEAYVIELPDAWVIAREHMDQVIRRDIRFDIGGDKQRIHQVETTVSDVTFKHILLPVWLAAYRYRGESYRFVVNARTGRVSGERPWSPWKIAFAVLAALIAAGIAGYFLNEYQ
jgi:DNA-directed RNA polymerase subunit RPC12/RpoP